MSAVSAQRGLSEHTYCPYHGQREGREGRIVSQQGQVFLIFFLKHFLCFLLYLLIPRHTGHFLRCLWALPDTKCRKGESTVYFPYATLFIHGVFLETNIRNDLPSSNTMWNDISGREKPRGQHKRKTGDNKKGLQLQ